MHCEQAVPSTKHCEVALDHHTYYRVAFSVIGRPPHAKLNVVRDTHMLPEPLPSEAEGKHEKEISIS